MATPEEKVVIGKDGTEMVVKSIDCQTEWSWMKDMEMVQSMSSTPGDKFSRQSTIRAPTQSEYCEVTFRIYYYLFLLFIFTLYSRRILKLNPNLTQKGFFETYNNIFLWIHSICRKTQSFFITTSKNLSISLTL